MNELRALANKLNSLDRHALLFRAGFLYLRCFLRKIPACASIAGGLIFFSSDHCNNIATGKPQ